MNKQLKQYGVLALGLTLVDITYGCLPCFSSRARMEDDAEQSRVYSAVGREPRSEDATFLGGATKLRELMQEENARLNGFITFVEREVTPRVEERVVPANRGFVRNQLNRFFDWLRN